MNETEGKRATSSLSELDFVILRHLRSGADVGRISKLTKTKPELIGKEIARLQLEGYIDSKGTVTEKGLATL